MCSRRRPVRIVRAPSTWRTRWRGRTRISRPTPSKSPSIPDLARRYHVTGVPKTVVDETIEILGALPEDEFISQSLTAVTADGSSSAAPESRRSLAITRRSRGGVVRACWRRHRVRAAGRPRARGLADCLSLHVPGARASLDAGRGDVHRPRVRRRSNCA